MNAFQLCSTYEGAAKAAGELSSSSTLILDCEGRDIGMPGGALGLLALGNEDASLIYLFDVVALSDPKHPLLAPLLQLLQREDIVKVVWDGRNDILEIFETYNVVVRGVLDLQVAEVVHRQNIPKTHTKSIRVQHTPDYFKKLKSEIEEDPAMLEGIYRLLGLDRCAKLFHAIDGKAGKDPVVTKMHEEQESEMWMTRPLPAHLLKYSARDIELLALMHRRFRSNGYLRDIELLKQTSRRYLDVYPTRELRALHSPLHLTKFMPLDVLRAPSPGLRIVCVRCTRGLSPDCFSTRVEGKQKQRAACCRLCALLVRKEGEQVEWVGEP
ncbi:ribonuclease H-like domain-containing protein [Epithele typhae]|uniref:ribonuclease H-like domain-containing protein n=1 Tax=Epithele typhae TaxID=378194 RepID=UPI002007C8EA|nr:ribonuclease H-like domain-containing protein [Epithele typhae]KAH9915154.1 ribonuclease H-like domain-containing protein [Epithele typhae]